MAFMSNRPRLSRARRRAQLQRRLMIIGIGIIVLALLVAIIIHFARSGSKDGVIPASTQAVPATAAVADTAPDDDLGDADFDDGLDDLGDDAEDLPVAAPTEPPAQPAATPSPASAAEMAARAETRPTATAEGFMPVFTHAETEEKIVAITVDDCFQAENLQKIIDCATENGGKLTLFPIGTNTIKKEQSGILKDAWERGFELENHTYTHSSLYKCSDEEVASQVYTAQMALSHILGVEYQCHFLRPMGGDARKDQRLQMYASQMGYYGVAHWACSGSDSDDRAIARALKPGTIYLFHTTNRDTEILLRFIPWVAQRGYRMVTMNEMFGYPDNETSPLESPPPKERVAPPLEPYTTAYTPLKVKAYSWLAYQLQEKLIELGYLNGEPDGIYGDACAHAVTLYQRDHGLEETGVADEALLRTLLEAEDK